MVLSQNSLGQFHKRPMNPITLGTGWGCYPNLAGGGNESFAGTDSSKANMKAIQIKRTGGPEVMELVELPVPQPKANEAVVKIAAAGVNFIDVYNREGRYKAPLPLVLGQEGAGVVSAVGADLGDNGGDFAGGGRVAFNPGPRKFGCDSAGAGEPRVAIARGRGATPGDRPH